MFVVADVHERPSRVPTLIAAYGVTVEVRPLAAGDYQLPAGALVERKTVRGMHKAILDGTFWPQLGRLRRSSTFPYLLVEGRDLDNGPLSRDAIRGACIAVTDLGVTLLRSVDHADTAVWLYRLGRRREEAPWRDRPAYAQRPKRPFARDAAEAMLASVPGISSVSARALLRHFGSVAAVVAANRSEWLLVPGIGPNKASSLDRTLHAATPTSHSRHRE